MATAQLPQDETSKNLSRWSERWSENRIGWHQDEVHDFWTRHGEKIHPKFGITEETCINDGGKTRVFFPLCGKTVDMAYIASYGEGMEVVGVDGIQKALEEFAKENSNLDIKEIFEAGKGFKRFVGNDITLLKGDFFTLSDGVTGGRFDIIFDRGSMVAIDPSLREDYVKILSNLLKPGGKILIVAVDRRSGSEETRKAGPPFSVSESDVRHFYEGRDWVESISILEEVDEFERDPEQKKRYEGLTALFEVFYLIRSKAQVE